MNGMNTSHTQQAVKLKSGAAATPQPDVLFQPGQIGCLQLKNRIIKSPQSTGLSNMDGTVSQRSVNHYKRLAEGGAGLIMTDLY